MAIPNVGLFRARFPRDELERRQLELIEEFLSAVPIDVRRR